MSRGNRTSPNESDSGKRQVLMSSLINHRLDMWVSWYKVWNYVLDLHVIRDHTGYTTVTVDWLWLTISNKPYFIILCMGTTSRSRSLNRPSLACCSQSWQHRRYYTIGDFDYQGHGIGMQYGGTYLYSSTRDVMLTTHQFIYYRLCLRQTSAVLSIAYKSLLGFDEDLGYKS